MADRQAEVFLAGHRLGGEAPFVIAEAGVNHDGNLEKAHQLIDVAADTGAQCVKFQTFEPRALVGRYAIAAPYQARATGVETQSALLESLALPRAAWRELSAHAAARSLMFLSTPFDLESAELLLSLGVPALKVPSGELTNVWFIEKLAEFGVPLLISTGMGSAEEVDAAMFAARNAPGRALFHCVSAYPAPVSECNLRAIESMAERYGVPVGWSDHTTGFTAAVVAVALGARLFEKHLTLDRNAPGPDHAASLEPEEFGHYTAEVNDAVRMLGDGCKRRMPSEEENAPLVRRSWHAARGLPKGTTLGQDDLVALRPEDGVSVAQDLRGWRTTREFVTGAALVASGLCSAGVR